jgi:hypothetical protein
VTCSCHQDLIYASLRECPECGHKSLDICGSYAGCERKRCGWETTSWPESVLAQITAPHFVAGIVLDWQGVVKDSAPILNYMRGWTRRRVRRYVASKNWEIRVVNAAAPHPKARR